MLFREDVLRGIADGRVTLAFRRWRRAPPKPGSTLRTPVGVVAIEDVRAVDEGDITPDDVARTGLTPADLRASIDGGGRLLRIGVRLAGADPRVALRDRLPTPAEIEAIRQRLARFDAAADTPWTARYLGLIEARPATLARLLAADVPVDLAIFKRRVRQLKELGLTESLEVGYRLSPRGEGLRAVNAARAPGSPADVTRA